MSKNGLMPKVTGMVQNKIENDPVNKAYGSWDFTWLMCLQSADNELIIVVSDTGEQ